MSNVSENSVPSPAAVPSQTARTGMSTRNRILFFLTAWFIVLLPFLFWRSTWFGRPLSEEKVGEYLHDESKPRQIQHALVQIGERMGRREPGVAKWYPEVARLSGHRVEEIRITSAWVMGQDPAHGAFREVLRRMLDDPAFMVRGNAALSLVSFGDDAGRAQILAMLEPLVVTAPAAGRIAAIAKAGEPIRQGTLIAQMESGGEVRSPITGRLRTVAVAAGDEVAVGAKLATMEPGTEQVWEALRALYLIGREEDLPVVQRYERETPQYPQRIVQQARLTEQAIRERSSRP